MRPAGLLLVLPVMSFGQWLHQPSAGIPRTPDGKPILTAPVPRAPDGKPDLTGLWSTPSDRYYNNIAADLKPEDVLPASDALYRQRVKDFGKDAMEPLCLPLGPAAMTGPFRDFKIIQTPSEVAILFNDLTHRQIYLDGRQLEKNPNPTWMGYSVGRWEGDTLVVESNGYTPRVWLDWDGHPHSEDLRITERFRRTDLGHMEIRMTLDDPKAYAKPFTVTLRSELKVDTEMLEYVCNENEKDRRHMDAHGPVISEAPIPESALAAHAGLFDLDDNGTMHRVEITTAGGVLYFDQDSAGKQRLFPMSGNLFSLSGTAVEFTADGGFVMHWAEGDTKAVRRK